MFNYKVVTVCPVINSQQFPQNQNDGLPVNKNEITQEKKFLYYLHITSILVMCVEGIKLSHH